MLPELHLDDVAVVQFFPRSLRRQADRSALHRAREIVSGDRDMTACVAIRAFFVRCTDAIRGGAPSLTIDLGNVEQADTKLMACLVAVCQLARASSVPVELWSSQAVLDMIEFCKLKWLIEYAAIECESVMR